MRQSTIKSNMFRTKSAKFVAGLLLSVFIIGAILTKINPKSLTFQALRKPEKIWTDVKRGVTIAGIRRFVEDKNSTTSGKSCDLVYIDLGTNKGVQIRKLYEPWLYPRAKILPYYDKFYGAVTKDYRRQNVCAFGFEANPRHMKRLQHLETAYRNKGLNVTIYNNAVANRSNDTVTIYSETDFDLDWGAGIIDLAINKTKGMTTYEVDTVDIVAFINSTILPLRPKKVFMKMDIEGSEFIVLPHLLKSGFLCKTVVTEMVIEMHKWAQKSFHSDMTLDSFKKQLKGQSCAPTEIAGVDDESFCNDVDVDPGW